MKLKPGMQVICTRSNNNLGITVGETYRVTGVEGDVDLACGGVVEADGFNFFDDDGDIRYGRMDGLFQSFEIVQP